MLEEVSTGFVSTIYKLADILDLNSMYGVIKLVLDLGIVIVMFYFLFRIIKNTRAAQIIKGFFVILALLTISYILNLVILKFILTNIMTYGVLLFIVIFQPELRSAFEKIGRNSKIKSLFFAEDDMLIKHVSSEISKAVEIMSLKRIGALIVVQKDTKITEISREGITINGRVSNELLQNIFTPRTLLHDGAVIIDKNTIVAAKCVLPLASESAVRNSLGTRHRAAIGITEISDALAIVISEENGNISLAEAGKLKENISADSLKDILYKKMESTNIKKGFKSNIKNKNK